MEITSSHKTDELVDEREPVTVLVFPQGNKLKANTRLNEILLLNSREEIQLSIQITDGGLIVNVNAKELNIQASDQLRLSSKKIHIAASEQLKLSTDGNMLQQVNGDCLTEVEGTQKLIAQVQKITASLGNVEIKANDDVRLNGERVKLNSTD
ncbi:MAG: hypothetical protein JSS94_07875 [Bacteroidetes bacterium]|nr:hypothetical protein [Bacteroidota bacterium]